MIRRIIQIDEEKCNGCGACAAACHEGAIGMVNGKAKLLRDDYCDGLGDCLPACPVDAIRFIEREAAAYDESAVLANKAQKEQKASGCSCPGSAPCAISNNEEAAAPMDFSMPSRLKNWPVQIKLAPVQAPYFDGADLLIAADCTAYSYGAFHEDFLRGRVALIGCPKLDNTNYADKLTAILRENDIRSVTLVRMQVPCCGGLAFMLGEAMKACGKQIPVRVVTIGMDGRIL
jgi:Fe-S-cluster-containing hydrogenase component 2